MADCTVLVRYEDLRSWTSCSTARELVIHLTEVKVTIWRIVENMYLAFSPMAISYEPLDMGHEILILT